MLEGSGAQLELAQALVDWACSFATPDAAWRQDASWQAGWISRAAAAPGRSLSVRRGAASKWRPAPAGPAHRT